MSQFNSLARVAVGLNGSDPRVQFVKYAVLYGMIIVAAILVIAFVYGNFSNPKLLLAATFIGGAAGAVLWYEHMTSQPYGNMMPGSSPYVVPAPQYQQQYAPPPQYQQQYVQPQPQYQPQPSYPPQPQPSYPPLAMGGEVEGGAGFGDFIKSIQQGANTAVQAAQDVSTGLAHAANTATEVAGVLAAH